MSPLHDGVASGATQGFGFAGWPDLDGLVSEQLVEHADEFADLLHRHGKVGRAESVVPHFDEALG